jgi:hypothetical protein
LKRPSGYPLCRFLQKLVHTGKAAGLGGKLVLPDLPELEYFGPVKHY